MCKGDYALARRSGVHLRRLGCPLSSDGASVLVLHYAGNKYLLSHAKPPLLEIVALVHP